MYVSMGIIKNINCGLTVFYYICFLFAFLFWMFGFVYNPALLTWKSSVPTHHQEPLTRLRYTSSILLTLLFFRLKYISYHSEERSS